MSQVRSCWAAPLAVVALVLSGCSNPPSPPISLSLSPSSPQAIDQGLTLAITATLTNDSSSKGATWSLNGPGSLSSSTGPSVIYNTPTTNLTNATQATVTATSVADPTKSASLTITVNPGLAFVQSLANGIVGVPYNEPIVIGGTAPFQLSIYNGPIETGWEVGGSLPNGLTFSDSTGTISGTPTAAGTWYFEAIVIDAAGEGPLNANFLSVKVNPVGSPKANPVPFLNQPLVPTAVSPGGPALTLGVSGTGFVFGATVDFNGAPLTTTFVDSEHLSAVVPAASGAAVQTASITVVNPAPGGGSSNVVYFQVGAPESTVGFASAPNSPLNVPEALGLAVADFNQDGKPDLAVAANTRLYVMLGNGDGTFTPASGSPVPIPSPPYDDFASPYAGPSMAVGDFTHSGYPGLAVGEMENAAEVILQGNGNGTFSPSSAAFAYTVDPSTIGVEAADFNADGYLDLAIINGIGYTSFVTLGFGSGAFNMAGNLYPGGFSSAGAAVGDFNRDGKLDVAIASGGTAKYPGSGIAISLGNGDGTFTQANGSPISLGQSLSAIVASDFNGDGKLDLAVTDADANTVSILLGNGDGTFQAPITAAVGNEPAAIIAGDFNNDGKLDLAIANSGDGTVSLLLGNGDGTFTEASGSPYVVGGNPLAIAAADFKGDGKLDLAVTPCATYPTDGCVLLQQ